MRKIFFAILLVALSLSLAAAEWRSAGPAGVPVSALVVAPSDPQTMYASSWRSLFRSTDGGETWTFISSLAIGDRFLAVDPHDPARLYAGTRDGVFLSADSGASWQLVLRSLYGTTAIVIDPRDPRTVYSAHNCQPLGFSVVSSAEVAAAGGVWKSTDGGATWTNASAGLGFFQQCVKGLSLDPVRPDTLYLSPEYSDQGDARSDDGAASWQTAATSVPGGRVVVDPMHGSVRFGIRRVFDQSVLLSTDGGETWVRAEGLGIDRDSFLNDLAIDPASGRLFASGREGSYRSGDGGRTWAPLEGDGARPANALSYDASSGRLTIATRLGLYRSPGWPWNEWSQVRLDFAELFISELTADPNVAGRLYASSASRLFVTDDNGHTWRTVADTGPHGFLRALTIDGAGTVYGVDLLTSDAVHLLAIDPDGSSWRQIPYPSSDIRFVVADSHARGELYAGNVNVIFHTRDAGANWEQFEFSDPRGMYPRSLAIDPRDSDHLLVSTDYGMLESSDHGKSWTLHPTAFHLNRLTLSADGRMLYAIARVGNDDAIARSSDGGVTWTTSAAPVKRFDTYVVDGQGRIYVATGEGVYRSVDGGANWEPLTEGMPEYARGIASLAIDASGRTLHAGTASASVWEIAIEPRKRGVSPR